MHTTSVMVSIMGFTAVDFNPSTLKKLDFDPSTLKKLDFDPSTLKKLRPSVVLDTKTE